MKPIIIAMLSSVIASITINAQSDKIVVHETKTEAAAKRIPEVKGYDQLGTADYECVYQYDVVATKKNGDKVDEKYATILQFNPTLAKFVDLATYRADSIANTPGTSPEEIERMARDRDATEFLFSSEVYQNYPEGKITYVDIITPNYVDYTEEYPPFDWEISEDTLTVSSYPCMKAICEYGGRKWTAWFTDEIPASFGPWKFSGLPGLIMKVTDDEGIHTFTAVSFSKADSKIVKVQNAGIQHTSRDKFVKNKNYVEEDPMNRIPVQSIQSIDVLKDKSIRINGVPLVKRPNAYTPIELK
ncbi:MAG: GLPGLI family protein [Duncaniella sp.]|nr:GLPGLI family protein [Muribaculum sp.]MCM1256025.1 GLPGLI family protein [Duncaniella sp.]